MPNTNDVRSPWYDILQNSDSLQAVSSKDGSLTYVIFYEAGSIKTGFETISADKSCMVMKHDNRFYVSDPSRHHKQVEITINGKKHIVKLNTWQLAGKTVVLE